MASWRRWRSSRPTCSRRTCACRTPTRPATSRRCWPRASIACSSPTSPASVAATACRSSRGRCSRASSWPRWWPRARHRTSCRSRSAPFARTARPEAAAPRSRRAPRHSTAHHSARRLKRRSRKARRRSTCRRPNGSWRWAAGSRRRSIWLWPSSSPRRSTPNSRRRGRSATTAGCPWNARSAAPARPWRRSSTWRWAFLARSNTWSA